MFWIHIYAQIWLLSSGECMRKIDKAHDGAIVSICFSNDSVSILTGSFDTTARYINSGFVNFNI